MTNSELPELEKPGAGVPRPERFVSTRILRPVMVRVVGWEGLLKKFEAETRAISELVAALPGAELHLQARIDRSVVIEDGSRYWSIGMTIEHLLMTAPGMASIADSLLLGQPLDLEVSTAQVKPKGVLNDLDKANIKENFRAECGAVVTNLKGRGPGFSGTRHLHPWFGLLCAVDWVWWIGCGYLRCITKYTSDKCSRFERDCKLKCRKRYASKPISRSHFFGCIFIKIYTKRRRERRVGQKIWGNAPSLSALLCL